MLDRLIGAFKQVAPKSEFSKQQHQQRTAAQVCKKTYVKPAMHKLNFEQGALILLGRAWAGDQGAKQFLTHLFPSETKQIGS
jgi:hypothetical protein